MSVSSDFLDIVQSFLSGSSTADDLDAFLAVHAQGIAELDESSDVARLAGLIQITLVEIDDGLEQPEHLREVIWRALRPAGAVGVDIGTADSTFSTSVASVSVMATEESPPIEERIPA